MLHSRNPYRILVQSRSGGYEHGCMIGLGDQVDFVGGLKY